MNAQAAFLADGKRLRGLLLNLLSAQFDDGTQAVLEANQEISNVNTRLSNSVATLANIVASLAALASIVIRTFRASVERRKTDRIIPRPAR